VSAVLALLMRQNEGRRMRDEHKARELRQAQLEAHQKRDEDQLMDFWEDGEKSESVIGQC